MKVRVLIAPPVGEKHGVCVGRVFERVDAPDGASDHARRNVWVMGDVGERVRLLGREYEVVSDDQGGAT